MAQQTLRQPQDYSTRPAFVRLALGLSLLALWAQPLAAHDLWLIPPEQASAGTKVVVHANVGMDFPNSESAADPGKFKRRAVLGPDGKERELVAVGQKGKSGLLEFTPSADGVHVLVVETQPKRIELSAESFNAYLVADGLPHIYRLRAKEKSLAQPAQERYSKYVKTLVKVGQGAADTRAPSGLLLEVVPLSDPFGVKKGGVLPVRVDFQGKPLADANLGWQHPGDGDVARGYVRTDARGEALIPIARTGLMTLRLTHMTRPKAKDYEWESFWTTLTWRVAE